VRACILAAACATRSADKGCTCAPAKFDLVRVWKVWLFIRAFGERKKLVGELGGLGAIG
jgi:hypothetical protein